MYTLSLFLVSKIPTYFRKLSYFVEFVVLYLDFVFAFMLASEFQCKPNKDSLFIHSYNKNNSWFSIWPVRGITKLPARTRIYSIGPWLMCQRALLCVCTEACMSSNIYTTLRLKQYTSIYMVCIAFYEFSARAHRIVWNERNGNAI